MFDRSPELPGLATPAAEPVGAVDAPLPNAVMDAQAFEPGFDDGFGLAGLSTVKLGRLVEANALELRVRETRQLRLAVAWADAHDADIHDADLPFSPLVERPDLLGGAGNPQVSEFCTAEFAALQGLSYSSGRALLADALDVRYRLPRLWRQVLAGEVRGWKARQVAVATRDLSWEAAADVDHAIAGLVESVPWPRFQRILGAAVLEADPALRREREERARSERKVWVSQSEFGLKTLIARANAGDVTWFLAAVNRIADILKADGNRDPIDMRRATAIGILAQPAVAVRMLADHAADSDPDPDPDPADDVDESAAAPELAAELDAVPPVDLDLLDTLLADAEPDGPESPTAEPPEWLLSGPPVEPAVDEAAPLADPQTVAEAGHISQPVGLPAGLQRVDPKALRPRVVLYFHLAEAAVRDGHGLVRPGDGGALTLVQLQEWLTATDTVVQVRPVIVPADTEPVDGYEIPHRVREATRLRHVAEVWPYGTCTSAGMDLDHTRPYLPMVRGGPPGQTGVDTLGPLGRRVHRAATHGGWKKRQPAPGVFLFRSPHGWIWLVTNHGTLPLGNNSYAHAAWVAAAPSDHVPAA